MQDNFQWNDILVEELVSFLFASSRTPGEALEQFKASKAPKKEWEIAAFQCELEVYKIKERQAGYSEPVFSNGHGVMTLGYGLNPANECNIHSVRLLSDDWTVSVKDRVKTMGGQTGTIKSFDATGHILFEDITGLEHITTIQKLPQPILTTDGMEVSSPGIEIWVVEEDTIVQFYAEHAMKDRDRFKGMQIFSTRKAAEDFVLNAKPLLSLNDVKEVLDSYDIPDPELILLKLTALVKQKLNQ